MSNLSFKQAMNISKEITTFGKNISDQKTQINVSMDLKILGIKKGHYDLQRFIYQYFFKCYWNKDLGKNFSEITNYDWYHPKYAWRHTKQELKQWCHDFNLQVKYIRESDSGYTLLAKKIGMI